MKNLRKTLVIEAALAGLFFAVAGTSAYADPNSKSGTGSQEQKSSKKAAGSAAAEKVHCLGVNACKGTSECAVEGGAACKGQNACKGKGWTSLTKKECKKAKGTIQTAMKH